MKQCRVSIIDATLQYHSFICYLQITCSETCWENLLWSPAVSISLINKTQQYGAFTRMQMTVDWTPHPVCFGESVFPSCLCSGSSYEDRNIWASVRTLRWKTVLNGRKNVEKKILKYLRKWNSRRSDGENVVSFLRQGEGVHSSIHWHKRT